MSTFYRRWIRPGLFALDSEVIHTQTVSALAWASQRRTFREALSSFFTPSALPISLFGLSFPNPVGLAAGMDKYGAALPAWETLGFGFCEVGGVTWNPQPGNPLPRLFRLTGENALINRMGFNNPGAEALARTLAKWRADGFWPGHPVGINLGKSKDTPLEHAPEDYAKSFRVLRNLADFFVINVSSPNTPGLRQLQNRDSLEAILSALQESNPGPAPKPLLIKVDPDLDFGALDEVLDLARTRRIAGIVATNTTVTRPSTGDPQLERRYAEPGGLSGAPLRARSTEVIRHIHRQTRGQLPIIGVGGIFNSADAWEKITAGASLVQLYTGLVYEGPSVVREIISGLQTRLSEAGFATLSEVVGQAKRK